MDFESTPQLLQSGSHCGNSYTKRNHFRARSRSVDWHATAIVSNPELEMRIRRFHCDPHLCRLGMTEDVGKSFLNDSQHRALPLVGQFINLGSDLDARLQ